MPDRPTCNWKLDADGYADVRVLFGGTDCAFPPGFKGWTSQVTEAPATGASVSPGPRTRGTVGHPKRSKPMDEQIPAPAPPTPVAAPQTASVGVPAPPSAADLSKIAADAGGGSVGLLMAALAILGGGGAVWKFLNGRSKQQHEQRMKELELQADNQKRDDDRHTECKAARDEVAAKLAELDAKVSAHYEKATSLQFDLRDLQTRLAEVQAKLNAAKWPDANFDSEDFESRMAAVEKKLKAKR
jgi:hypothetical protein